MKRPTEVILTMLGTLAFTAFVAVMLLEWMAGCGETYIAADGKRYAHECMFIGKPMGEWFK